MWDSTNEWDEYKFNNENKNTLMANVCEIFGQFILILEVRLIITISLPSLFSQGIQTRWQIFPCVEVYFQKHSWGVQALELVDPERTTFYSK